MARLFPVASNCAGGGMALYNGGLQSSGEFAGYYRAYNNYRPGDYLCCVLSRSYFYWPDLQPPYHFVSVAGSARDEFVFMTLDDVPTGYIQLPGKGALSPYTPITHNFYFKGNYVPPDPPPPACVDLRQYSDDYLLTIEGYDSRGNLMPLSKT